MLKGLDPLLGPELLHVLASMGHGDQLGLVDRNFPAAALNERVVRLEGVDTLDAATAILSVFPLDSFGAASLIRMEIAERPNEITPVQAAIIRLAQEFERRPIALSSLARHDFYEAARESYAIVTTGELTPYSCFIFVKGVIFTHALDGDEKLESADPLAIRPGAQPVGPL